MNKLISEFKEFALRGNVVDMAVGVVIGGAFGKIVTSLVEDITMPAISIILGTVNFADLSIVVNSLNAAEGAAPIEIRYGMFLQNIINFVIIAVCIFTAIKIMNAAKRTLEAQHEHPQESVPEPPPKPEPTKEELLLTEIRDILKNK